MPPSGAIRAARAYVELFADDSKLVRGLRRAQAKLKAFGKSVQQFGRQLLTIGSLAVVPFALSAQALASFESQMARVKALTGATGEQFTRLEQEAKRLGATTVFSASQAAEAMSSFALAGFSVDQILTAIGPTLDLAAAGQIEIAEAADIAAKIMSGMGLSADHLGHAVDVMAKAMTTANTDLTMLGEAFKYVGPMAKSAGISLEEITGAVQMLSNAGIQGEMAGSTLRGILLSLTSPSAAAANELKRLGVRVTDEAGNVRGLADILGDLERGLSGVGSGEKLRVLGTIFPARQAAGAAELVSQGADRLREATAALGDASGTASRIAGTQLDTLKGDVTILLSALEGVAIAIGEAFGSELRAAVRGVTSFLSALGTWIGENKQVVLTTVGIIVGILAAGVALIGLGGAIQLVAFGLGGLATAVGTVASLLGALLSPIGLILAGIGALGAYLIYTSDLGGQALDWLGAQFNALKSTAIRAFGGIGDALAAGDLGLAARILWLTLEMEWQKGINALNQQWVEVKRFFVAVWTEAVYGAAEVSANAWAGLQAGWAETVDFLADAWALFTTGLTKTWNTAIGFIRKAWVRLKSLFDSEIDAEAEITRINAEVSGKNESADSQRNQEIFAREQQRRARLTQIGEERSGTLTELEQMRDAEHQRNAQQFATEVQDSQAALDAARREWQAALEVTSRKRSAAEAGESPDQKAPADLLKELEKKLTDAGSGLQAAADKVSVSGTFNAAAVRGLSGVGPEERTAKATEETAKNTKRLLDEARFGPAFT
ncbi:phage tail tape measure protein [Planctomicrobium sp. SH661]|uniref:phage tail tape measure protein n=1 Tax=Planctomicrobium sp. SH661 TaxID=3448124 RepID=UPI003F5B6F55